jgi:hypothetical protein
VLNSPVSPSYSSKVPFSSTAPVRAAHSPFFQGHATLSSPPLSNVPMTPKVQYGHFENNLREGIRIAFVHILPLALAPISLAGWPGFLLSLALMPLLYVAGKIGRYVGRHVDPKNLTGVLKLFHRLHALLNPKMSENEVQHLQERLKSAKTPAEREEILRNFSEGNHVDKINDVLSDFVATSKLPGLFSSFVQNESYRKWMFNFLKINPLTKTGRFVNAFINNTTLFKNQVFSQVTNSTSASAAMGASIRGAKDWYVDFQLMPKIGRAIDNVASTPFIPGFIKPFAQGAGVSLKNWFLTKSAWDAAKAVRRAPEAEREIQHAEAQMLSGTK